MHLIIGGAFQGKEAFAKDTYGFSGEQIFRCTRDAIDFSLPCITNLEEYVYGCVLRDEDPVACFRAQQEKWEASVLICRDISGGLVPIDRTDRVWREATGKLCQYLSREAKTVSRIFCGLEQRLK